VEGQTVKHKSISKLKKWKSVCMSNIDMCVTWRVLVLCMKSMKLCASYVIKVFAVLGC